MKKDKKIILFGTGSFAEVAFCYFGEDSRYEVVAFTADDKYCSSETVMNLPLVPFSELEKKYPPEKFEMHIAVAYNKLNQARHDAYFRAKEKGYILANYIHSGVKTWKNNQFGDNIFIFEDNTIQPFVEFGSNIVLWSGNHIGHHSKIGNHTFLTSHVVVSGFVNIGEFCFFGVNATIRDSIDIADKTIIGAGALILKSTEEAQVYIGPKTEAIPKKSSDIKRF